MGKYYLGVDVGSSKTHALVVDENGSVLGFGRGGPGNHESVGYDGFMDSVRTAIRECLKTAGITDHQLQSAGFGISGYDWQSEYPIFMGLLKGLDLPCKYDIVNDTCLGLLAGSPVGWGVAVVAGTGCNCWGWTEGRKKIGRVTGSGTWMGEGAGASELVYQALQSVAHQWTMRGPATRISDEFIRMVGARDLSDLLEGLTLYKYEFGAEVAPLIFRLAGEGDRVAMGLVDWAGTELGELACCVIRQLAFEKKNFDVVLIGSMFDQGELLIAPMRRKILELAPGANLVCLAAPPVVGAAILAMETVGITPAEETRLALLENVKVRI
jgi:N-acetylglucosamine kinase-like BadF-type ATPase